MSRIKGKSIETYLPMLNDLITRRMKMRMIKMLTTLSMIFLLSGKKSATYVTMKIRKMNTMMIQYSHLLRRMTILQNLL